jgi:hypothetical protein
MIHAPWHLSVRIGSARFHPEDTSELTSPHQGNCHPEGYHPDTRLSSDWHHG